MVIMQKTEITCSALYRSGLVQIISSLLWGQPTEGEREKETKRKKKIKKEKDERPCT